MRHLRDGRPELDAVIVTSDLVAMGVRQDLRVAGRRLPEKVAVVGGFENSALAGQAELPLTSVHQSVDDMGREMVRPLVAQMLGEPAARRAVMLEGVREPVEKAVDQVEGLRGVYPAPAERDGDGPQEAVGVHFGLALVIAASEPATVRRPRLVLRYPAAGGDVGQIGEGAATGRHPQPGVRVLRATSNRKRVPGDE